MASSSSSSCTTLVNVVPDAEHKLVRVLASSSSSSASGAAKFTTACESAISQGDAALLLKTIIDNDDGIQNALFVNLSESEAVSAVSLLGALLNRVDNNNASKQPTASALLESLSSSIVRGASGSGSSVETSKTAITLLAALYNIRSGPTDKVKLLTKMIDLAVSEVPEILEPKTSKTSVVLSKFVVEPAYSKTMFEEWNNNNTSLDVDAVRKFYRSASNAATAINLPTIAQHFLLLEVQTYNKEQTSNNNTECIDVATKASTGAIRDPVSLFTIQRNMLVLPAIKALEGKSSKCVCVCVYVCFLAAAPGSGMITLSLLHSMSMSVRHHF